MKNVLKGLLLGIVVVAALVAAIYVVLGLMLDRFHPPVGGRSAAGGAITDTVSTGSVVIWNQDTVATIETRMRWRGQPSPVIFEGSFRSPDDARRVTEDTLLVGTIEPAERHDVVIVRLGPRDAATAGRRQRGALVLTEPGKYIPLYQAGAGAL